MSIAMVSGMHNDFVFVEQIFMGAGGSEFQKMHIESYINILAHVFSPQESDKNELFLDNFLAY
jgi:hypothetical protein